MADSYRTNQWFGLSKSASGESLRLTRSTRAGYAVSGSDNDNFIYPDRAVRIMDGEKVHILKRGYIRSVAFGDNRENFPINKCQFQFNPSQIVQSVQQNTQVLNFLQQDPAQYAQPMFGNVTFSFDLFFDRSMEINNWKRTDEIDPNNPWENSSPSNIGVLHDLSALFKVIGVGVNESMAEYLQQSAIAAYNQQLAEDSESAEDYDMGAFTTSIEDLMQYNLGNSAFLLPLPVRVVFSSLYIVEGLVKDINIMFSKFTAAMVPMQCSVQVLFEAKYIGFAKQDTYFTYALRALEELEPEQPTRDELAAYGQALTDDLTSIRMLVTSGEGGTAGDNGDRDRNWNDNEVSMDRFVSKDIGVTSISNRNLEDLDFFVKVLFDGEQQHRRLLALMEENGRNVSVGVSGSVTGYRYTDTFKDANSTLFARLRGAVSAAPTPALLENANSLPSNVRGVCEDLFDALSSSTTTSIGVSAYEVLPDSDGNDREFRTVTKLFHLNIGADHVREDGIIEATNGEEWRKMADWACTSDKQRGGISGSGQTDKSTGPSEDDEGAHPNNDLFYFAVRFRLTVTVSIDGLTERKTVEDYLVPNYKGTNFRLIKTMRFDDWPSPDDPLPPGDNGSTGTNNGGGAIGRLAL